MVKTRRSVNGHVDDREYCKRSLANVHDDQDVSVDGWSPRALRSHYRVTRKRQHWPAQLVSHRLSAIKMPRMIYPESEDTDAEKFSRRRRRPVRVFYKGKKRVCRVAKNRHKEVVERQLRPLRPNNYMEESDKPLQESECHVRRSGRQRKLIHHTFNESWITNELKVKGYPRLFNRLSRMSTSSDSSSEDERLQPKSVVNTKQLNGEIQSDDEQHNDKISPKKTVQSTRIKKEFKTDEERDPKGENGSTTIDSDKSENKKSEENGDDNKVHSGGIEEKDISNNRCLRSRRPANNKQSGRNQNQIKKDIGINSHSQQETGSESDNSSDSGSGMVVRRSNRTRKPRNSFIESASCEGKQYTMRKKPYNMRKTYSLRERKQPKIIVRSQSPNTSSSSSSSSDSEEDLNVSVKNKTKTKQKSKTLGDHTDRALREIQPIQLDGSIRFSSVGGLEEHIRCLREMVLFPLMYPQLFEKFGTHPPKGVLFHGPPGTGKTLLARALANECSIQGGQKVSFFLRKGADCLKKWVGESERNIKLLFQQATKMKPSIIFFDELDALAPVRSARQDQVHTSVVGTLLAEMDGLCDRGEVIIIGATNRLDSIDPALRRAGRFDRELHFPYPPANQRAAILKVLTSNWNPQPLTETVQYISDITTGYGGSDLKALCSESVLKALERTYPQVYKNHYALLIDPQKVEVQCEDMVCAMKTLVAAGSRSAPPVARSLTPHLIPLLSSNLNSAVTIAKKLYPPAEKSLHQGRNGLGKTTFSNNWSSVLLLRGSCAASLLAPALLASMEHCAVRELSVSALHQGITFTPEQAILSVFSEIRRCSQGDKGCIVYAPSIDILWPILGDGGSNLVVHLWQEISATNNCLLLATSECSYVDLPQQIQELFPLYKDCIYDIKEPTSSEITSFLKPLFLVKPLELPISVIPVQLTELPKAPPPPAPRPTALELRRNARREAHLLRELRIFLRDVCRKLAANRRFYKFTKPVDLDEVTDYLLIIKEPMDLETMMTKVDMHRYNCARDFLKDIDLICANALEYNPDSVTKENEETSDKLATQHNKRTSSDKQIRHEACSLRDHAYALVEVEMDTDFEEECRGIAARRAKTGNVENDLPNFIYTANHTINNSVNPSVQYNGDAAHDSNTNTPDIGDQEQSSSAMQNSLHTNSNKRKRKKRTSLWSKGIAKKAKVMTPKDNNPVITDEESKENKPLCCPSPTNGEPSMTDNDTGPSEHDHASSKDNSKSNDHADQTVTNEVNSNEVNHGIVRKLQLDKDEMLFDANAMDGVTDINKLTDCPLSPGKNGDRCTSNIFTSTPHRKKSSSLEHSNKDCDNKFIINKEELETVLQRCVKSLKSVRLKPLVDLYCQLDRVINKYNTQYDRSNLPSELQATVNKFTQAMSLQ